MDFDDAIDFFDDADEISTMDTNNSYSTVIPCFVRDILISCSNSYHPITQQDIIHALDRYPYSIEVDRKVVAKTLDDLMIVFPYIRRNTYGYYYDKHRNISTCA